MKSALEIRESRRSKREQMIKKNAELVNKELLELEKLLNKYESNIEDEKSYITVPIIIKTNKVKQLLEEKGYIIDKVSNDIEYGTTRIWVDKDEYRENVKDSYKKPLIHNENGIKIRPLSNVKNEKKEIDKTTTAKKEDTTEECVDLLGLMQRLGLLSK
jgi:hypothetical protein